MRRSSETGLIYIFYSFIKVALRSRTHAHSRAQIYLTFPQNQKNNCAKSPFKSRRSVFGNTLHERSCKQTATLNLFTYTTRNEIAQINFDTYCAEQGPTITLIKSPEGYVFGGYAPVSWTASLSSFFEGAHSAFIFTLSNPHSIPLQNFICLQEKKDVWKIRYPK